MSEAELEIIHRAMLTTRDIIRANFPDIKNKSIRISMDIIDECETGSSEISIKYEDGKVLMVSQRDFEDPNYFKEENV